MRPNDLLIFSIIVVCGFSFFLFRRLRKSALEKKLNSAKRSKLKTMELLQDRGYSIVDFDRSVELCSVIDGKTYSDVLKVDFVVQKGHLRYLVKIASDGQSSRLGYRENRGTLIGISAIFRYPNLLLVDPERKNIRLMKTLVKEPLQYKLIWFRNSALIFLLGAICAIIIANLFFQGGYLPW